MTYLEYARKLTFIHSLPPDFVMDIEGLNMHINLSLHVKADNGQQQKVTRGLDKIESYLKKAQAEYLSLSKNNTALHRTVNTDIMALDQLIESNDTLKKLNKWKTGERQYIKEGVASIFKKYKIPYTNHKNPEAYKMISLIRETNKMSPSSEIRLSK